MRRAFGLFALLLAGCSSSATDAAPASPGPDASTSLPTTFGGDRPTELRVPANYDPKKPAPLLLVLHGYGSGGVLNDVYMHMTSIADAQGFFYVSPDGTIDKRDKHFWNATDACCNFDGSAVDDVAYLTKLVDDIRAVYAIDPKRIFVLGHSNGGYMANRLACDRADMFAAVVSWTSGNWSDPAKCNPSAPIGYLQMHGVKDGTVPYGPGDGPLGSQVKYPGAEGTAAGWAAKNGCSATLTQTGESLRVNADAKAVDTKVARHDGCKDNGAAELWPVEGADHIFSFSPEAVDALWKFFSSHAKR